MRTWLAHSLFPAFGAGYHVFASSCDWFIALFTSIVIGQSSYFGFGLTTLKMKIVLTFIYPTYRHFHTIWYRVTPKVNFRHKFYTPGKTNGGKVLSSNKMLFHLESFKFWKLGIITREKSRDMPRIVSREPF